MFFFSNSEPCLADAGRLTEGEAQVDLHSNLMVTLIAALMLSVLCCVFTYSQQLCILFPCRLAQGSRRTAHLQLHLLQPATSRLVSDGTHEEA